MTDASDTAAETSGRSKTELALRAARLLSTVVRLVAGLLFIGCKILLSLVRDDGRYTGVRQWMLLSGNRLHLIAPMVVAVFLVSLVLGVTDVIGVRESSFVTTMFSTIVAGLFSFVPIVVSVNNLAVSRLFDSPESLRERVDEVKDFRSLAAAMATDVTVASTDPAGFLATVVDVGIARSDALVDALENQTVVSHDAPVADELRQVSAAIRSEMVAIEDNLAPDDGHSGSRLFDLLVPMMNAEFSQHSVQARRIRLSMPELPTPLHEGLTDLEEVTDTLNVTRQYYKAIYLQQELATFSRYIAYSGVTAFLTSTLVIMIYASGYPVIQNELLLIVFVTFSLAIAFSPFAILFAYMIRIATVVKRTSAPGAFTPHGERPNHVR